MNKKRIILISAVALLILLGGYVGIFHKGSYWCRHCCVTATGTQWLVGFEPDNKIPITKMKYTIQENQKHRINHPVHAHEWIISQGNDFNMGGLVTISCVLGPITCDPKMMPNKAAAGGLR